MYTCKKQSHPTEVLAQFFDAFSLPSAQDYLLTSFMAAESTHVWKKSVPYDLMYFFEKLSNLIHAMHDKVNRQEACTPTDQLLRNIIHQYSKKKWDEKLNYILSYAFMNTSLSEAGIPIKLIHLFGYLKQILEISYLLKA